MKALFIFIALLAQLSPTACNRSGTQTASPTPPATVTAPQVKTRLELKTIELHKVKLAYPHKLRDKEGKEKVYEQAWLVKFFLNNLGPPRDMGMDLFIGDYRIPEYGSFEEGIYFRIYEESLLASLEGKDVSVSFSEEKRESLQKTFSIQGYKQLSVEEEPAVLNRSKQAASP